MRLLNERTQARTVAERWRRQYPDARWPDKVATGRQLDALDPETATAEDFRRVIGNDSWCCPTKCRECGLASWNTIELGEEPSFDSATTYVCLDCLRKAVALSEGA